MSYWNPGDQRPERYEACLCQVVYKEGPAFEVLYHHPRKGWVFRDGLELTPSARMTQWVRIERIIREPLS